MKKRKVEIGKVYSVKVGDAVLPVRIDAPLGHGRYEGMDMHGGKLVKVAASAIRGDGRSPKQWHVEQMAKKGDAPAAASADQKAQAALKEAAKVASKVLGVPVGVLPPHKGKGRPAKSEPKATKSERKPSGLDAAAKVLAEAGEALNTAEMVKRMLGKGLWKTSGKTPAATIYAAIIREIATKGKNARFRKTERGKFELAK
jgi:hypothetical protein